ncbi:MAG: ASCH domain-containing protein [Archaeoglobales archaeon]|nr:MAG: ASCH domain-containing protein [Archaeoglobales archaeon]
MEKINFDAEFVERILEGKKITTIRKGIKSYPIGKVVELTVNYKPFAVARVVKVVVKRVKELTNEDAIRDGFENRDQLMNALRRIYGEIDERDFVTIVHFNLLDRL